jgi:hypothetical protein
MDRLDWFFWLFPGHRDPDCGDDGPDSDFDDGPYEDDGDDADVWKD